MKAGTVVTIVLTVVGLCAVVFAFVKTSSPYVTVAQAKQLPDTTVHLAGEIDKSSISVGQGYVRFSVRDEEGATATVVFDGIAPNNLTDATKVVAIGTMKGDVFSAEKLLLKCPSKYDTEAGPKS